MSDDASSIIRHQNELESNRSTLSSWWQQIGDLVDPTSPTYQITAEDGERRTDRAHDITAIVAKERLAAFLNEGVTPRDTVWHTLAPEDDELADDEEAKEFLERLAAALFKRRYASTANFVSQRQENYSSMSVIGNYSLFVDEAPDGSMRYRGLPMSEVFWAENHQGLIDTQYHRYQLEAHKAVDKFGPLCPARVKEAAERSPSSKHEFIFCVRPNEDRKPGALDWRGWDYAAYDVYVGDRSVIRRGGFRTFPFANGRFMKSPRETYARGPAMMAWGAILTVNDQKRVVLKAAQKDVDPPILCTEDGILDAFNMRSGAMNYGGLSEDGAELVKPFTSQGRIEIGVELMEHEQRAINEAFLVSLLQVVVEKGPMTATETLARLQEKAELLSPTTGRLEAEDLGVMVEREIDIYTHSSAGRWVLEQMPDSLRERQGAWKNVFTSPLSRARRAGEALAIMRTWEAAGVIAGVDPDAMLILKGPESVRSIGEINGMPAKLMRTIDEVEKIAAQRRQQQAMTTMAQLAPDVTGAAKNIAQAEQIRRSTAA